MERSRFNNKTKLDVDKSYIRRCLSIYINIFSARSSERHNHKSLNRNGIGSNFYICLSIALLPTGVLANSVSQQTGASGSETTVVPYVSSVNLSNEHMTETPKIHGIILD